ncbi:hypothetical protein PBY51_003392 [Eleginops maclovinus]|uniref:Uncharacterized protein n=1 Tax=Eleginops maclovinus TaxID=56733 RepID=A0AAN8APN4_ELEMC|nr:hypothetical protein PBY51_003392 [Eleginops maclovinus]
MCSVGQCTYFSSIGQECQISQAAALLQASAGAPPKSLSPSSFPHPERHFTTLTERPGHHLLFPKNFL